MIHNNSTNCKFYDVCKSHFLFFLQLFAKHDSDETEILEHTKELLEQLGPDTAVTEDGVETVAEGTNCEGDDSGEGSDDGDDGVCGRDGVREGVTESMDTS